MLLSLAGILISTKGPNSCVLLTVVTRKQNKTNKQNKQINQNETTTTKQLVRKIAYIIIMLKQAFLLYLFCLSAALFISDYMNYNLFSKATFMQKASMQRAKIQHGDKEHQQIF